MASKKDVLLAYCKRGFYLFPVRKETKRPAIKDNLNQASNDINQLMEWDAKFPNCNWAVSCAKSGLVVVDVDHAHGGMEAWATMIHKNGDPETLRATSGSGGFHYVFKADKAKKYRGKIQKGIDIKYNGYFLVYPSIHESSSEFYKWDDFKKSIAYYPTWLGDLIEKDTRVGKADPTFKFGNKYLEKLVDTLKKEELDYEEWMQAGMALHAATDGSPEGLQLYLELTQGASYQDGDLEQAEIKWDSFSNTENGISQLTLGYIIRKKGGIVPSPQYEEDLRAFKEAKLESIKEEEEKSGFVLKGEKMICWKDNEIVDHFNEDGYAFLKSGGKAPFMKVSKSPRGSLNVATMNEKGLKDLTSHHHKAAWKDSGTDIKVVFTPAYIEWRDSIRRKEYDKIVFKPNAAPGELNLWADIPMDPLEGDCSKILEFIHSSLCNSDKRKSEWLLDWLAHLVQKPHERTALVPVLIGKQGTGKGILMDGIMGPILGDFFTAVNTSAELMARFNIKLSKKFLTFIDEATWRGNKTEDGILKRMVGSPTMTVEEKHGAIYDMENYSRYVIASNNMEAVALEVGNRRYVVIETADEGAADPRYFDPIGDYVSDRDNLRRFLGYLLNRDISNFHRYKILENNTAGSIAKIQTMGPVGMFWDDCFSEAPKRIWDENRGLHCNETFDAFLEFTNKIKTYEKAITPKYFWAKSEKFIPALPKKIRKRSADGNPRFFRDVSPEEVAESFYETAVVELPELPEMEEFFMDNFVEEGKEEVGGDEYDF